VPVNDALASENWTRFQYCRDRGHLQFVEKADKCDKFFAGEQWAVNDLNALILQRRPALTINKIISTVGTMMGEQIYNRSEVLFRPSSGSPSDTAEALTKVWMQIAQANQLPWLRSDVFADGLIRSRGFYDARMDFNDSMQGLVRISQLNSKNVVIDPDAEEYDPDSWMDVFTTKWVTPQDIELLYSKADADYLRNKDGSAFPYGYDSLERVRDRFGGALPLAGYYGILEPHGVRRNVRLLDRQYRRIDKQLHFVDVKTGDTRPIPGEWDDNKISDVLQKAQGKLSTLRKKVKRVRWTVTADNIVLHDDWSPYKHFTVIPYFPYFRYGRTIGVVENLLGPQELLNKSSSQELHIINTSANSGWMTKVGNLVNMTTEELEQRGAETGLVLELNDITQIAKIQPNMIPQGIDRITDKAEEHIKTISNVSDSMQGFDREDVAAKAIKYKTQRGSVNMTKVMDNLERTDFLLARNVLDMVQAYYTEERVVNITHTDVLREPETVTVNQYDEASGEIINDLTLGEYDIVITSTPYRATMEDSQFEQAIALREQGIQIPDDIIIENSRLMRKAEIVKRMQGDKESPEAKAAAALQQRMQTAEVSKAEAEVGEKTADTQLKLSRAKKDEADAQAAASGDPELIKMQQEQAMEERRMEHELAMEERKMAQELEFKREEMQMKREEHQQQMAFKVQEHEQNQAMKRAQQHQQVLDSQLQQSLNPKENPA
jgi:hypothetical protein